MFKLSDMIDESGFGTFIRYSNELTKATEDADKKIDSFVEDVQGYLTLNKLDIKENEDSIRDLIKSWKELGDEGQKKILLKLGIEWEGKTEDVSQLSEWQKKLSGALGTTINIDVDSNFNSVYDEMKKKYKELKTRMDEQKPILIKFDYDFDKKVFINPDKVSPVVKQIAEGFKADSEDVDNLEKGVKEVGKTLADLFTPKEKGGSKKDKVVDGLKKEVEVIKDAKKQYDELRKLMSKEDAFDKLKSLPEYENIKLKNITDEGYVAFIREQLEKIKGRNTEAAKNIRIVWNKELGEIQIKLISDEAQKEIAKIDKFLSQYKDRYSQYQKLFEITGDKGQAAQLIFGDSSVPVATYIDTMKEKLKSMSGGGLYEELLNVDQSKLTEPVRKLVEEISKSIQEQDFTLKVDMAKIIADYATTEEKITAIHNQYEAKREEAKKSGASEEEINKALIAYDKAETEAIAQLKEELWQLTPFYRQLFGDLSDISYRHLKKMVTDAKETVNQIASTKVDPNDENSKLKYGKYDRRGKLEGYYIPNADGSISDVLINLKQYEKIISKIATIQRQMRQDNPFDSLLRSTKDYKINEGTKDEKQMPMLDIIASKAADANEIVQDLSASLGGMFDALGNDSAADATAFIGEMVNAATNIATGISSGNPAQVISGIVGGITTIAKNHDKKLDRAIEKSKIRVKELQNAYTDLEMIVSRQLGAMTSKQASDQLKNLEKQREELQKQRRNEVDKKKTDWGAVADYDRQIKDLGDQIRYFYEDLAGEQFGIKIKDWAKNIADALVDAWAKGEDAAKAFDNAVADIMRNVFESVMQLQYVEPAMKNLRNYLFGDDGRSGILGDGEMSENERYGLVKELAKLKQNLGDWQNQWETLVEVAKQAGINLEESTSENTLSKGIAGVTEDTANLLASYLNAMRTDLSLQLSYVGRILALADRNTNYFALMQADIMLIQMNTLRTANNTDRLVELSQDTYSILRNASISGSGVKFNIN